LGRLLGGHALRELPALDVTLENEVRALRGFGVGAAFFEKLAAQRAAAEAIDGVNLLENLLAPRFELRKRSRHGCIISIQIQHNNKKPMTDWLISKLGCFFCLAPVYMFQEVSPLFSHPEFSSARPGRSLAPQHFLPESF